MINVLTDLESVGVPVANARVNGSRVLATLSRERMTRADWTTHDYNLHFVLSLANDGETDESVEICVECDQFESLPKQTPLIYSADSINGPWRPADLIARTDGKTRYAMRVSLRAGAELHIANTLPRPLGPILDEMYSLADQAGGQVTEYGASLDGRPLLAIEFGKIGATPILVTSGFHPPEPDTLATLAILQWLGTEEGKAAIESFRLVVVPVVNPDGYARGTQGSNAAGINMYWHFARELPAQCPEAAALWRYAEDLRPRGYIDFHCYTLQLNKRPGPYTRPLSYYRDRSIRETVEQLYNGLAENPDLIPVKGFPTFAPHTLGSMLASKFQTITLAKYHLHLLQGIDGARDHSIYVLRQMLSAIRSNGLSGPAPSQSVNGTLHTAHEFWAGCLRPQIGYLRRGKLKEFNVSRTALVDP